MPPEIEWFANITNPRTRQAYKLDVEDFMRFVGIVQPEEFRIVTRSHVIAWRKALESRSLAPASIRRKLLHLAPEIIQRSHTVQGIWETTLFERQKRHGRWEKILKPVTYHEFVAVVGKARMKVIVKTMEGGVPHFWSIIPFWRMNTVTSKRKLYDGDPEVD